MSKQRINFSSGSPWEPLRGFSRAVVIGDSMFISGTTATDDKGDVIGGQDPYEQTRYIIQFAKKILSEGGFSLRDVFRTRMYVTNISKWDDYARAHREAFENIRPVSSIVQVTRLTDPRLLVEMEFEAIRNIETLENRSVQRG